MASLRQRMLEDMQVRRLSPCTQRTYVETVARFARYFERSPARLGPEEIRAYQVYLTTERRLAPSSLVVAVSALRFLYRVTLQKRWAIDDVIPAPKKPRSLPVVLSPEEVVQFLDGVKAAKHHVGRGGATPAHVQKMAPARTLARLREQERRRCARFKLPQPFDSPAPGPDRLELEHAGCKDHAAGCCRSSSRPAGHPPSWPAAWSDAGHCRAGV